MNNWITEFVKMYNDITLEDYIDHSFTNIYHYTSPDAFKNIIKKSELRFTDRSYLNDKSEGFYCLDICLSFFEYITKNSDKEFAKNFKEKLEERKRSFHEYSKRKRLYVYQCSFSCDSDSLCMWNYYSKSSNILGYNLHFESLSLKNNLR